VVEEEVVCFCSHVLSPGLRCLVMVASAGYSTTTPYCGQMRRCHVPRASAVHRTCPLFRSPCGSSSFLRRSLQRPSPAGASLSAIADLLRSTGSLGKFQVGTAELVLVACFIVSDLRRESLVNVLCFDLGFPIFVFWRGCRRPDPRLNPGGVPPPRPPSLGGGRLPRLRLGVCGAATSQD